MGNVDTTVANMSTSSESVGVIRWGDWSISRTIMPTEGGTWRGFSVFFRGGRQLGRGGAKQVDEVEISFKGERGDQGRK